MCWRRFDVADGANWRRPGLLRWRPARRSLRRCAALPLVCGMRSSPRAMRRPRSPVRLRRHVEYTPAAVGLLFCLASASTRSAPSWRRRSDGRASGSERPWLRWRRYGTVGWWRARAAPARSPGLGCDLVAMANRRWRTTGRGALAAVERTAVGANRSRARPRRSSRGARPRRAGRCTGDRAAPLGGAGISAGKPGRRLRSDRRGSACCSCSRSGLCVLPAFFAIGVVPLLATVVGATLGSPSTG